MQDQQQHGRSFVESMGEKLSRAVARGTSRRSWLGVLGGLLAGTAAVPLLPVARAAGGQPQKPKKASDVPDTGNPASCDYWRYCAIDGFLCSCCGGSANTCPPGTEMSPVIWIGTCLNPVDGIKYVISYNDCCGRAACGNCFCNRNEGDRPMYHPSRSNDLNWCLGTASNIYNCSTATIIGSALEP